MRKLYRSRRDKKIMGICGGLSEMLNVDATLLRILLIVITIFSSGTVIFIYLIAGMVIPKEPPLHNGYGPSGGFGGGFGNSFDSGYGHEFGNRGNQYDAHNSSYNPPPQDKWGTRQRKEEPAAGSQFDKMMDDLEKKTLRREIDELKSKLAKYEKGE